MKMTLDKKSTVIFDYIFYLDRFDEENKMQTVFQ